jgi:uncharacterized protein YukE
MPENIFKLSGGRSMNRITINLEMLESLKQDWFSRRLSIEGESQNLQNKIDQLVRYFPAIEEHKASESLHQVGDLLNDFKNKMMSIESLLHHTAATFKETEDMLSKQEAASAKMHIKNDQ